MKKSLIAGAVILAGAAATPYLIANQAEKHFDRNIEQLQQAMVYPQLKVEAGQFEKGWLSSRASTYITFTPPEQDAEPLRFEIVHQFNQIPPLVDGAILGVDSSLFAPPPMAAELDKYLQGEPLVSAYTLVEFDGSEVSTFSSPAYSGPVETQETLQVEWQGINGQASRDGSSQQISFDMEAPLLQITANDGELEMRDLSYKGEMQPGMHNLWFGNASATLDSFKFHEAGSTSAPGSIQLNDLAFSSAQMESGPLVDISNNVSFASASFNGMALENGRYDVAYKNLDGASLSRINESVRQIMQQQPEDPSILFQAMLPHIESLLSQQPELVIRKLSLDTPMGNINADMRVTLTEPMDAQVMQQPAQLMNMVEADLNASLPKPMFEQIIRSNIRNAVMRASQAREKPLSPEEMSRQVNAATEQQLQGLLAQKLVIAADGAYTTAIRYNPGKLLINGQDATPMLNGLAQ